MPPHVPEQVQTRFDLIFGNEYNFFIIYEARPQSKFLTRPTASKPYIAGSDCAYVIEQ
jgi:hypothetical protein